MGIVHSHIAAFGTHGIKTLAQTAVRASLTLHRYSLLGNEGCNDGELTASAAQLWLLLHAIAHEGAVAIELRAACFRPQESNAHHPQPLSNRAHDYFRDIR